MSIPPLVLDSTGISGPSYAEILAAAQTDTQSIFGSDAVLTPDSQDGQFLAIFSQAVYDAQQAAIATYQAFSPATAQGAGLSQVVKINGIRRAIPTKSTATVTVVGVANSVISNGQVGDNLNLGTVWNLPATVTIPGGGTIDVTATCSVDGATTAAPNTLTRILTPTTGWQTANNAASATVGAAVETDANLRRQQANSTALPAQTVREGIEAAVGNVTGVSRVRVYQNDTNATDSDGIPGHNISIVVAGGSDTDVAAAIAAKKPPGIPTYGDVTVVVFDSHGVPDTINFFRLTNIEITVVVNATKLAGYVSTTSTAIQAAVAAFVSALDIGEDSYLTRLFSPANLPGTAVAGTYVLTTILQAASPNPPAAANVVITFKQAAVCSTSDVTVNAT